MLIAFVVIFLLSSFWIKAIAVDQQMGYNPFLFGTDLFCIITRLILLVMCIWYLGWIAGIIVSVLDFFGIISGCFSWFLNLPFLAYKSIEEMHKKMRFKLSMLPIVLIVCLVFTIVSFFTTRFASLYDFFAENIFVLFILMAVAIVSNIFRIAVMKSFQKAANIHSAEASPKAPCNNDCSNVKEQELEEIIETVSNITDQELLEIENQLRTCDTKDLFFKYYQMFAYSPHLSENSSRSPITAAYLFVIFDRIAFAQNKREKSYEILSLIEKEILSPSELDCYDKCVNIFGAVARGEITPRGDWMFFDGDTGGNWLYALYLCYGDLIRYPQYISDYKHHPIIIHDYFELMKFSDNFSRTILLFTREFTDVFSNRLS